MGSAPSATVSNLPATGVPDLRPALDAAPDRVVLHRLHVHGPELRQAAITSPAPGSTLAGTSVTFTWSAGTGAALVQPLGRDDPGRQQSLLAGDGDGPSPPR